MIRQACSTRHGRYARRTHPVTRFHIFHDFVISRHQAILDNRTFNNCLLPAKNPPCSRPHRPGPRSRPACALPPVLLPPLRASPKLSTRQAEPYCPDGAQDSASLVVAEGLHPPRVVGFSHERHQVASMLCHAARACIATDHAAIQLSRGRPRARARARRIHSCHPCHALRMRRRPSAI